MISSAYAAVKTSSVSDGPQLFHIFWNADIVVQLVFLILIGFSVACWAIVIHKTKEMRRWKKEASHFSVLFSKATKLSELVDKSKVDNPLTNVFRSGLENLSKNKTSSRMAVERATEDEVERIEQYLPFLATTGSLTPFIGLFGTVWGILIAFWKIGKTGSSSLAVVGPYLAEALIATAMGLAAAIPALIFYNYFVRKTRTFIRQLENFSEDLNIRVEREYF